METTYLKLILASLLMVLVTSGCVSQLSGNDPADGNLLSDFGPAPELTNDTWLNVGQPLRLEDLRWKTCEGKSFCWKCGHLVESTAAM